MNTEVTYGQTTLAAGICSRFVDNANGLRMHVLEAGEPSDPCVLFLHGFPELAYSWRHQLLPIAEAGYHVIAPDQRGYGRTTGWDPEYDGDLASYRMLNLVADVTGLLAALSIGSVELLVGHDFGSPIASWCALTRQDLFERVVLMSSPFGGVSQPAANPSRPAIHDDLAALTPPRKHYQWYYSTREANDNMWHCPQGVHDFLRAYYHHKSADWPENRPCPLEAWRADVIARMPRYYVMDADKGMAETVCQEMPSDDQISSCRWLRNEQLAVYAKEYQRNGFQGGLQWYRCTTGGVGADETAGYAGRTIDIPTRYLAGRNDWGTYQKPGSFEAMQTSTCTQFLGAELIEGAGHWVQQEQPELVTESLLRFLDWSID
ncbi:alpha/beta hydrolase [bacterium]|nr:alpha/beta hydrolase [bacterium]